MIIAIKLSQGARDWSYYQGSWDNKSKWAQKHTFTVQKLAL